MYICNGCLEENYSNKPLPKEQQIYHVLCKCCDELAPCNEISEDKLIPKKEVKK